VRTADAVEARVLAVRDAHPAWGARKITRRLEMGGLAPPAASTAHAVLRRHGRIAPEAGGGASPWQRFERDAPNRLRQVDYTGWESLADGRRCHPLTVIDDHSRYAVCLEACADQRTGTVRGRLRGGVPPARPAGRRPRRQWRALERPVAPAADAALGVADEARRRGCAQPAAAPAEPRARNERLHRTLEAEVFALRRFAGLPEVQRAFDLWRHVYNCDRPHEGIGLAPPASRYRPSPRRMPEALPGIVYDEGEITAASARRRAASASASACGRCSGRCAARSWPSVRPRPMAPGASASAATSSARST
jgi:transposase InsO family protein